MVSVNASTAKNKRDPQAAKERILQAALAEFSEKGLGGARVDQIAERAGANKRMLYHYFGNKDDLFLAVLEFAYSEIRSAELELNLDDLSPEEGMRRLVAFTFDYFIKAPYFIKQKTCIWPGMCAAARQFWTCMARLLA